MTESTYIDDLKSGSQEGFVAIYRRFYTPLLYFILKYVKQQEVAEEILGDVFINLWRHRGDFQTMDHLRAFLYVAAKNASLNNLRSNKYRLSFEPLIQSEDLWNKDPDTFTQMIQIELIQAIFEEVERLPQKQKQVFNLTYFEDKTAEEIAKQLNISVASVYTNRSRALSTLRLIFKSKSDLLALAFFLLFKQ